MSLHSAITGTNLHEAFHYVQSGDPGAVGAGKYWLDTTSEPYVIKRRNGTDTGWITVGSSTGGDVATDTIWDAKGDLAVGTGANTASRLAAGTDDYVLTADAGEATGLKWAAVPAPPAEVKVFTFCIPGTLTTGAKPVRLHAPLALTVTNVLATVGTAPTGASIIVDVNKNGTTLFTTQGNRPTIAAAAQDDTSSTPDVTSIAQDDVITIDIDQIGSTVAGSDLVVQVRCTR